MAFLHCNWHLLRYMSPEVMALGVHATSHLSTLGSWSSLSSPLLSASSVSFEKGR
jgi:hypothetical protein